MTAMAQISRRLIISRLGVVVFFCSRVIVDVPESVPFECYISL